MIQQTLQGRPTGLNRKPLIVSVALHVGILGLVLVSPLLRPKSRQAKPTRFFEVVNVQAFQPKAAQRAKPTPRAQHRPTDPQKTKPQKAPSLAAHVIASMLEDPGPLEDLEYALPAEVRVANPNFQYDWYLSHIQSKVERNWDPPRGMPGSEDMRVVLLFEIERNGAMSGLRVESESGNETLDHLGLRAVQRSAPFPRLPNRFSEQMLEVRFTLNYIR